MAQSTELAKQANSDVYLEHARKTGESALKLTEAQSEHLSRFRKAKASGVNIDAMKQATRYMHMDPHVAGAEIKTMLQYLIYSKAPAVTQADLFEGVDLSQALGITLPSEKSQAKFSEYQAELAGFEEGKKGGSVDNLNAVYGAGTPNAAAAVRGYQRGQQTIADKMKEGASKGTEGTGRRGGRGAKQADAEVSNVVKMIKPPGDFDEMELSSGPTLPPEPGEADDETEAEEPGDEPEAEEVEPGEEPDAVDPSLMAAVKPTPKIDMLAVPRMSIQQMAKLVTEVTGNDKVAFATRKAAVDEVQRCYIAQRDMGTGDSPVH